MTIQGLEILSLEAIENHMPQMAAAYDCGPMPIVNGKLWSEKWRDAYHHNNVRVEAVFNASTGIIRWAIREGPYALTKGGIWTQERRRGHMLNRIRYDTAKEAIAHYFQWKAKIIKWAQRKLAKNPQAVLNYR
jgi:hypothetical protein